jgi:hypothetical protein
MSDTAHSVILEGNMTLHTAASTAFPQPAPGTAPMPGPMASVPADQLRKYLGLRDVNFVRGKPGAPALTETPLAA